MIELCAARHRRYRRLRTPERRRQIALQRLDALLRMTMSVFFMLCFIAEPIGATYWLMYWAVARCAVRLEDVLCTN